LPPRLPKSSSSQRRTRTAVVDALARKGAVEYDQVRGAVSETLGIRSGTLDELVTARRETIAAASDDHNPPHWAVGDAAVMRSADLVAALAADPEAPWAEFNQGKPITQRQLARMLGQFGVISDTVHPPGLPAGKGYKRSDLEPLWAAYCPLDPGQNAPSPEIPISQAYKRTNIDGMGITRDSSSVQGPPPYGSKTADLSYSHADLYGCTDENGVEADASHSDQGNGGNRARPHPPVCVHCGSPEPTPNQVVFDGLNIWLHRHCEAQYRGDDGSDLRRSL
jgi:hypothetical protein